MGVYRVPEIDYSKSTGAYPLPEDPTPVFVDQQIDYSKSTGAFPMYDDRNAPEIRAAHYAAEVSASFPTPGPISYGVEDRVLAQRKQLGLSDDPTGESDAGYEARPSTVVVPGADGVDRQHVYDRGYLVDQGDGVTKTAVEGADLTNAEVVDLDGQQIEPDEDGVTTLPYVEGQEVDTVDQEPDVSAAVDEVEVVTKIVSPTAEAKVVEPPKPKQTRGRTRATTK